MVHQLDFILDAIYLGKLTGTKTTRSNSLLLEASVETAGSKAFKADTWAVSCRSITVSASSPGIRVHDPKA